MTVNQLWTLALVLASGLLVFLNLKDKLSIESNKKYSKKKWYEDIEKRVAEGEKLDAQYLVDSALLKEVIETNKKQNEEIIVSKEERRMFGSVYLNLIKALQKGKINGEIEQCEKMLSDFYLHHSHK